RQHHDEPAGAERQGFREGLDEIPPPPPRNVKSVHKDREAFVKLASPGLRLIESEIDARIEIEEKPPEPRFPAALTAVVVEKIAQACLGQNQAGGGNGPIQP